ncbi:MAG: MFS transporter [Thermomicrobiales bacterium]
MAVATDHSTADLLPDSPVRRGRFGGVLTNPALRQLWLAQLFAGFGQAVATVAMPLLVYDITGSAGLLSLVFILQQVPWILLSPIGGLLADRLDRRRLMIAADLERACLVVFLPFTTEVWQIALIAGLAGIGNAIARPAELAAVPMVATGDQLVPALSLSQVSNGVMRIAGPAAGAGIVGIAGPDPAFWLQAACFFGSVACLWNLVLPIQAREAATETARGLVAAARRDVTEGLRTVWRVPIVRGITATEGLWGFVNAGLVVAGVVLTKETLNLGDRAGTVFGLLTASASFGAVLGALLASRVERRIGRPLLMAIGYLGPLMIVPTGLTPPLWTIFLCWFALGFTDAWAVIAMQSYLAEAVPDNLRGRVYATWGAVITFAGLIAFALVGWMTPRIGAPLTLTVCGAIVGIGGPLMLILTGALADVRRQATGGRRQASGEPSSFP